MATYHHLVLGYLPNSSLAVEAMLATASIGAIWSSTSPDFGVKVSGTAFSKAIRHFFVRVVYIYVCVCKSIL